MPPVRIGVINTYPLISMTSKDFINADNTSKARSSTFNSGLPDLNAPRMYQEPHKFMYSSRVRLTDVDRLKLKDAYRQLRDQSIPATSSTPGSTVSSTTYYNIDKQLGMGSIVMSDLLGTRESIPVTTILHLQSVLGVEVVSKDDLLKAADSYVNFIWDKYRV